MSGNIKVVCRFRPQNRVENENNGKVIVDFSEDKTTCEIDTRQGKMKFTFDRIFDWKDNQKIVFDYSAKPVVDDVMNGYNGTILTYGQTGSGKTFTMQGPDIDNSDLRGVIPRVVDFIFTSIERAPMHMEFTVQISYMEIYLEKIRDLLDRTQDNLPIHEDKIRGIYVKGLREVYVSSPTETLSVMKMGTESRVVSSTNMNEESSRSHSVMILTVNQKDTTTGSQKSGKLYLVDLAGSEMVSKTGATGQTLEEAKKINKSLTTLGMVINSLTEGKSTHIPYRDSKLTRILQESLGGNSKTMLVINCSPSSFNEAETTSTLRFGLRAKKIQNKAKINQELSAAELKKKLDENKKEISLLRKVIEALEREVNVWRSGGKVAPADYVNVAAILQGQETPAAAVVATESGNLTSEISTSLSQTSEISETASEVSEASEDADVSPESARDEVVENLREEIKSLEIFKDRAEIFKRESDELRQKLSEALLKLDKQTHLYKEAKIGMESIQLTNVSLEEEVLKLKTRLVEMQVNGGEEVDEGEDETRKNLFKQKMAEEMATFKSFDKNIMEKEKEMRETLRTIPGLDQMHLPLTNTNAGSESDQGLIQFQQARLVQLESQVRSLMQESSQLRLARSDLELRIRSLETDYEILLDEMIAKEEEKQHTEVEAVENIHDFKNKLESQFNSKKDQFVKQIEELRKEILRREEEIEKSNSVIMDQKWQIEQLQSTNNVLKMVSESKDRGQKEENGEVLALKMIMGKQLDEFNRLKEHLMTDLQNRCQKVVELEIQLDEARDKYNSLLRTATIKPEKPEKKKVATLEKNVEQLTTVYKQLVEQNATLKRESAISTKKLEARNERISNLEILLDESNQKLEREKQRYEKEIETLREELSTLNHKERNKTFVPYDGRVAKPIRGGAQVTKDQELVKVSAISSPPPSQPKKDFLSTFFKK